MTDGCIRLAAGLLTILRNQLIEPAGGRLHDHTAIAVEVSFPDPKRQCSQLEHCNRAGKGCVSHATAQNQAHIGWNSSCKLGGLQYLGVISKQFQKKAAGCATPKQSIEV